MPLTYLFKHWLVKIPSCLMLGRVNYDFKGKYLLSAAIRRDGLSVWAPGKKWATFPSASIGWRIDQEDFMQNLGKYF